MPNKQVVHISHPHLEDEWDAQTNGVSFKETTLTPGSDKEVHWRCKEHQHSWSTPLSRRTSTNPPPKCPICANKTVLAGFNDLASQNPTLAAEYSPQNPTSPDAISTGSHAVVTWECSKGHQWEASIKNRNKTNSGCPICKNKKALPGFNDLTTTHPKLVEQWHPTKNGELKPEDFTAGSKTKIWWQCDKGHESLSPIYARKKQTSCSTCTGNKKEITSVLDTPSLNKKWDTTKNLPLTAETTLTNNKNEFWWTIQECGHAWKSKISAEARRKECPICTNRIIQAGINDLATTHPEIASVMAEHQPENITPQTITSAYPKSISLQCPLGHTWTNKPIQLREKTNPVKCPTCEGHQLLTGFNDLATTHPAIAEQWHPTKNSEQPTHITYKNLTKVWWQCQTCTYEWQASPSYRVKTKSGCRSCARQTVTPGFNDLATTHPEIAKQWHPIKNGELKPNQIMAGSDNNEIWWLGACNHEWQASPSSRTGKTKTSCPTCANQKVLPGFNDLATTEPEIAKQWHPTKNGKLRPVDVTSCSTAHNVWWQCNKGHEWQAKPGARTNSHRGCPICANQAVLLGFNDAATTHPELIKLWHPTKNTNCSLQEQTAGSGIRPWWICDKGHEWQAYLYAVSAGSRCPKCTNAVSKAEQEIVDYLKQQLPHLNIQTSVRGVIGNKTELDIYIPEKNIAVEFNGLYWHDENHGKTKWWHQQKYLACQNANIQLIQIWEDDWNERKEFIKLALLHKLQEADPTLRIGARKLKAIQVDYQAAATFLNLNHIQGAVQGTRYYTLSTSDTAQADEDTKAVLVIKKVGNKGHEGQWRIERYATSIPVPGGFTKLLKHAERELAQNGEDITQWVTFSDNCISDGGLYANNGFTKDKELEPDYMYVKNIKRIHKFNYRLKRFKEDPELKWDESLSEAQLAKLNNLPRIWDAGKIRWTRTVV